MSAYRKRRNRFFLILALAGFTISIVITAYANEYGEVGGVFLNKKWEMKTATISTKILTDNSSVLELKLYDKEIAENEICEDSALAKSDALLVQIPVSAQNQIDNEGANIQLVIAGIQSEIQYYHDIKIDPIVPGSAFANVTFFEFEQTGSKKKTNINGTFKARVCNSK